MVLALVLIGLAALLVFSRPPRILRQLRRFGMLGYLTAEAPSARGPIDTDARFAVIPTSAIHRPLIVAGGCVLASIMLFATGWPLPAVCFLVVGVLSVVDAVSAARRRRVALTFEKERQAQPPPPGWFWTDPRP